MTDRNTSKCTRETSGMRKIASEKTAKMNAAFEQKTMTRIEEELNDLRTGPSRNYSKDLSNLVMS